MRFTCDGCGAQYMISDDKVGPGGVKVRCKRCSHVILVRPAPAAAPVMEPAPAPPAGTPPPAPARAPGAESGLDDELGQAFDNAFGDSEKAAPSEEQVPPPEEPDLPAGPPEPPAPAAPAQAEVEWYVAVSDAQVGPLLPAGVKQRWETGEIGPDSLVWRPGMADWSPLSSVQELAQYLAPFPRVVPRPAARAAEAAPAAEPAGASGAEPAREGAPEWKPAAASALAALASEELA
ncbi:MAG: zinc-ribbon domain-containing protein, partial [Deltaproteobacteria bacterium]|nr:zinc-ribbon domain-containing protein [Deltaproteobacteria bacterium]